MSVRDLIFVSMEDWDDVWRRNQFVCDRLVRRNPDARILFVGLPRNVPRAITAGRRADVFVGPPAEIPGVPRAFFTRPPKLLPDSLLAGRRVNRWAFRRHVRRAAKSLGFREPLLWLNPHSAVHMVGRMGESAAVYDVTDDWTTLTQPDAVTRRTVAEDAELCARADAVIVCSEHLYQLKRPLARSVHLVPNGVDVGHYTQAGEDAGGDEPRPAVAADWRRPVFGYVGTLHPDRLDLDLIAQTSRLMPNATFALVGPNLLSPPEQAAVTAGGNVEVTGPVPYAEVPRVMGSFDVCITPHVVTPFTESLNPIKLWEYLAVGKPIVSTPVAGFRAFPHLVSLAAGPDAFAAALRAALVEDPYRRVLRQEEAAKNGWDRRMEAIEAVLDECLARRAETCRGEVHGVESHGLSLGRGEQFG